MDKQWRRTPHVAGRNSHGRSAAATAAVCRVCLSINRDCHCVQLDILVNFVTGVVRFNTDTGLQETSYDLLDVALTYSRCGSAASQPPVIQDACGWHAWCCVDRNTRMHDPTAQHVRGPWQHTTKAYRVCMQVESC